MIRPVFKSHLQVSVIPGEGVLVLSDDKVLALHGAVYELLAPLIDGSRDEDELVDALAGKVDGAMVYYALAQLEKNGHLAESVSDIPREIAAFWHGMDLDPRVATEMLQSRRVRMREVGEVNAAPLRTALAEIGVVLTEDETADFEVVMTDDYLRQDLGALNAASLLAGRPWLLVKPRGHEIWLGPLFVPGRTGCYRCLAWQLARNRPMYRFVAEKNKLTEPPFTSRAATPNTLQAACQLAAVEVAKFISGAKQGLEGKVLSLDVRTWTAISHDLLKHPACPVCGERIAAKNTPVELVSRKATHTEDCGHRTELPEDTLKKYQHLVSPITGVVTMLAPVYTADGVVHVYAAGHNHAFKIDTLDFLKAGLRNASCGKGIREAQAKASALCEAIERYSAQRTGTEEIMTASFREMRERFGPDVIHPNEIMLYSQRQMAEHSAWNGKKSKFNQVPEELDESAPIDWTPVWSLTHARHKYLPAQLVYFQSKAGAACAAFYMLGCSNGNASGNNLEEAVLQGFCELVERDAVALWWYNRLRKPGVVLESFQEPYLLNLIRYYRTLGREAWALDITSDLGIPTFVAASRLRDEPAERILFGLGCHLNARVAIQRAFAELNQMLAMAQPGEDSSDAIEDTETVTWLKTATLANQRYLAPDETVGPKRLEDYASRYSDDLLEDILLCRRLVEERGMEMLVADQTRPETKMPVVKVIVPGLRHFWARFAPGRLYDVPVQMGWQKRALAEAELNPIPVFV
jgi:bacteriocin biosynthesis cyclodehydratase domain-containing protein